MNLIYYNRILSSRILKDRDLYLRYMDCPDTLSDDERFLALKAIACALYDKQMDCNSEEGYHTLIEVYILDHPARLHPNQYTPEEDAIIIDMKANDARILDIATRLNRTKGSISTRWSVIK